MLLLLAVALAVPSFSVEAVVRQPKDIEWKVSGTLPQGLATHDYHMIYEDAATHGIQTFVRFSKGYILPPHQHSHDETIIVLKGKLLLALGGRKTTLGPGAYAMIPAGTAHALETEGWSGCEMVVSFSGPMDFKPAAETARP